MLDTLNQKLQAFNTWFQTLSPGAQQMIVKIAVIAALVGPLLVGISKIGMAIGTISGGIGKMITLGGKLSKAFSDAGGMAGVMGKAIGFLTSPIGLVIAAIAAAIVVGVLLYKNWDKIKATAQKVFTAVSKIITSVMKTIKSVITTVWSGIKKFFVTVLTAIAAVFRAYFDIYLTIAKTVFKAIKIVITTIMNGIRVVIRTVWNAIKGIFSSVTGAIKSIVTRAWNGIKSVTSSVFHGVLSVTKSVWNRIKAVISSVVNAVRNVVSRGWHAIRSVTASVFNAVKNAMVHPIQTALSVIRGIVNRIKGLFHFSISMPHIPLPHFSISPSGWKIVATVKDGLGRFDTAYLPFEVHWSHQAIIPSADITVEPANLIVTITPIKPDGALDTDVCDIYRLSSDKPELIFSGASFGVTYVDPYPAFGDGCGHRVVMRTANGDYITAENLPAWTDYSGEDGDVLHETALVIDFDGDRVVLPYNVKLDHSWEKNFERTRYLGGSITGDWNEGVTRDLSVSTDIIRIQDSDLIQTMRRLADYAGICHVRTSDGSSFAADVEVSESREYNSLSVSFSLDIKKVEAEGFDGMTLSEWKELQEV